MSTVIAGIPVTADLDLPLDKVETLVLDIKTTWEWEGRCVGRIELKQLPTKIQVFIYELAATQFLSDL
ncbi:MAG: hypothetical protein E6713_07010 [Sporomusaceae bacterium]|nr:hypothetical protein [Sporomusaceae bacterium]